MVILGIETSCDETAAAVLQKNGDKIEILSNIISSSATLQQKYGGIIPEQAAREQLKVIIPVIEEAINNSRLTIDQIDAIAVTQGPGLIGSLLVGTETAKTLSLIWNKPLIPVNHLLGHFYANWIDVRKSNIVDRISAEKNDKPLTINDKPGFPIIGLLASGGHTDLVLFKNHNNYQYLGGTRDDAAGECFDKCARLLGLPYPGGPQISKLAKKGNPKAFPLPSPMLGSDDFDFSYSGLKTAVANLVSGERRLSPNTESPRLGERTRGSVIPQGTHVGEQESGMTDLNNLCASIELAIIKPLIKKALKAAKQYNVQTIILGGGVSANKKLKEEFQKFLNPQSSIFNLHIPPVSLCTDNAAMIASAAFFLKTRKNPEKIQADPNLSL